MISVIIPMFNQALYIGDTIESLLNQTYKDFELLLIDDGSSDGTVEIAEGYAEKDSRITVVRKKHSGLSETRNEGVLRAGGEYILFFDGDDIVAPYTLEHMIKSREDSALVYVGADNVTSQMIERWEWNITFPQLHRKAFSGHEMFCMLYDHKGYDYIKGVLWGMLIPKAYFDKMKPEIYEDRACLPITFLEDIHLTYRFFWNAEKVVFLNQVYVLHRLFNNSLSRRLKPDEYAFELMTAGQIQLEYLIRKKEKDCFQLALPEYLKTIMKLCWQVGRYEEDQIKKEKTMKSIINSFGQYYHFYKKNCCRDGIIQKISVCLFYYSPQIWNVCVGDIWFLLKYKLDQIKK